MSHRLKCILDPVQLNDRLSYRPDILEIQLLDQDLRHAERTISMIRTVQEKGVKVYLHHPTKYKDQYLDILHEAPFMRTYYRESSEQIARICQKTHTKCVIHAHYNHTSSSGKKSRRDTREMAREIERILRIDPTCFIWEDTVNGLFSASNPYLIEEIIQPLDLPRVIDLSHSFISWKGDNDRLIQTLEQTAPYAVYFHVVDSMGIEHDSLSLGQGRIDWKRVKPFVGEHDFIFEIGLRDFTDCQEMIESEQYWSTIPHDFS